MNDTPELETVEALCQRWQGFCCHCIHPDFLNDPHQDLQPEEKVQTEISESS